jgi:site-specific DNA-methyltransferase (adenine-specific)
MKKTKLMLGDNIESLKKLPDNSIDSVVTDPPYGLSFMNKKWDYDVPSVDFWKEVYRVLKPGGHILSFGGTRTYHRMVVNIEDAGFEIRDQIMWLYGSGFPKSHNIGKAVDKIQGNEREVLGTKAEFSLDGAKRNPNNHREVGEAAKEISHEYGYKQGWEAPVTKGQSEYEGWGTALKPANEPICVARKPLSEKSVAENVLKWGTGGINVDGCRVGSEEKPIFDKSNQQKGDVFDVGSKRTGEYTTEGRFPANIILECICDEVIKGEKGEPRIGKRGGSVIHDGGWKKDLEGKWPNDKGDTHTDPNCPCRLLDEQSGESKSSPDSRKEKKATGEMFGTGKLTNHNDSGGASRFFYQAKVSKQERNMGLDGFEDKIKTSLQVNMADGVIPETHSRFSSVVKNSHPTVKPINLMAYLCRLITPEGGIVLDPFMGSGSTGVAAQLEGFRFVGMEMDADYFKIAESRINSYEEYKKFLKK